MSKSTGFVQRPLLGAGLLASAAAIWSTFGILVRVLGYNIPFFYGVWTRNLAAGLILASLLFWFKKYQPMTKHDFWWSIARSSIGILGLIGSFAGFVYLPIGTAYFINFGGITIGSFVLGSILYKEKLTKLKIISLVLAMVGMLFVYRVTFDAGLIKYLVLIFIAGWANAFWSVSVKKISHTYDALQLNSLDALTFGILGLVSSLVLREPWSLPTMSLPWIANLCFLLMVMVTGQLVIFGFKHLDAQRGSLVLLLEVVLGTLLGSVVFHEQVGALTIIGGMMILMAAALPEIKELAVERRNKIALDK